MKKYKNVTDDSDEKDEAMGKAFSRCSPTKFISVIKKLLPILGKTQKQKIKSSPLAPWLEIPKISLSPLRVQAMLKRFEVETCMFRFGSKTMVPFISSEFSIVIGLPSIGQPVNIDLKLGSTFFERHFKGMKCVQREVLIKKLFELANNDAELDDFFRFFILVLFNCIIFPISNFGTPKFIFPYLDDLETFFKYAWGDAAFRFLLNEIEAHLGYSKVNKKEKLHLGGCIVGLTAWVYERVPILGQPRVLHCYPRLFKWGKSTIPINHEAAESALMAVTPNKIVRIVPFKEEIHLVGGVEKFAEDAKLLDHIKRLELAIEVLEERNKVVEENVPLHDKDDVSLEHDVDIIDDHTRVSLNEVGTNKVPLDASGRPELDSLLNVVVDEVQKRTDVGENDHEENDTGEENKINDNLKSSIVKTVQKRRGNRLKKRKGPEYITPPSTPRKRRRKGQQTQVIKVDEIGDQNASESAGEEEALKEFRGRQDYKGSNEVSSEAKNIIEKYLSGDVLGGIVWEDDEVILNGRELLNCLFGQQLRSDLIHSYFNILTNKAREIGHEIYWMSPFVSDNVIKIIDSTKGNSANPDKFEAIRSELCVSTVQKLAELNKDVMQRYKQLLFPICYKSHWFLVVYIQGEGFKLLNSLNGGFYNGAARKFANFLANYFLIVEQYDIGSIEVSPIKSPQQSNHVDCGVYVCLWCECFARDNPTFWDKQWHGEIEGYRAQIASTILSDKRGLFKGWK